MATQYLEKAAHLTPVLFGVETPIDFSRAASSLPSSAAFPWSTSSGLQLRSLSNCRGDGGGGWEAVCHNHNFADNDSVFAITVRNLGPETGSSWRRARRLPGYRENDITVSALFILFLFFLGNDRLGRQIALVPLVLVRSHGMVKSCHA